MTSDSEQSNQLSPIGEDDEAENAIFDLVGDIGPLIDKKPIVFIEGENSELDKDIIETFFPEVAGSISLVSSGSKNDAISSVRRLARVPDFSEKDRGVYALIDKDHGKEKKGPHIFSWDRFHIENYLLDEIAIFEITKDLDQLPENIKTPNDVLKTLKEIAKSVIVSLSNEYAHSEINSRVLKNVNLSIDYRSENAHQDLDKKVQSSSEYLQNESNKIISEQASKSLFESKLSELNESLNSEEWRKLVRGRDILKAYSAAHTEIKYKTFISLLKNKLKSLGREPAEMKSKIESIINQSALN